MNVGAKKSLGQNFLNSAIILQKMIETAAVGLNDNVLEAGPGMGSLTDALLKSAHKVIAVEKDTRLITSLKVHFEKQVREGSFELIEGDILDFDPDFFGKNKYKIVSNIPYYITGTFIRKFLSSKKQPESITLIVQKEVAERIVAKNSKESLLSMSVKVYGVPKYIQTVSRSFFKPQPAVDSAILHISNINRNFFEDNNVNEAVFFELLHAGFGHKRKQLLSNLRSLQSKSLKMKEIGLSLENKKARAEDLSLEQWLSLYLEIY